MSKPINHVETLIDSAIHQLQDFKKKLPERSYFKLTSVDTRVNEIKAAQKTLDAVVHLLKTGKGLTQ